MERGVEVNDVPATVLDDEEAVQQPERSGGHGEQIHGGDIVFMVAQESHPSFQLVGLRGTPRQVSRHRDLGDDETELGELSMDAWRPPAVLAPSCGRGGESRHQSEADRDGGAARYLPSTVGIGRDANGPRCPRGR